MSGFSCIAICTLSNQTCLSGSAFRLKMYTLNEATVITAHVISAGAARLQKVVLVLVFIWPLARTQPHANIKNVCFKLSSKAKEIFKAEVSPCHTQYTFLQFHVSGNTLHALNSLLKS